MKTSFRPLGFAASALRSCCSATVLAIAGGFFLPTVSAKVHLKISANGLAADAFENWTATGSWEEIGSFKNRNASRPVVDLILQLKALKAGGLDFDFELVRHLTYELAKQAVIEGKVQLTAETIWDEEIAANAATLLKSDAVIRDGEFVKGVYVLPTNEKLLKVSSIEELRSCTAAVVSGWRGNTIERMQLKEVFKAPTLDLVFTGINKHKADFVLMEFSSLPDLGIEVNGVRLLPVPNCKVAVKGSLSWVVSKAFPEALGVQQALVAGTKILRENGTIERAYQESGFFNPRVAGWKRIF